jgi:hypothetical protein
MPIGRELRKQIDDAISSPLFERDTPLTARKGKRKARVAQRMGKTKTNRPFCTAWTAIKNWRVVSDHRRGLAG